MDHFNQKLARMIHSYLNEKWFFILIYMQYWLSYLIVNMTMLNCEKVITETNRH